MSNFSISTLLFSLPAFIARDTLTKSWRAASTRLGPVGCCSCVFVVALMLPAIIPSQLKRGLRQLLAGRFQPRVEPVVDDDHTYFSA